jgi:hypothetical protein
MKKDNPKGMLMKSSKTLIFLLVIFFILFSTSFVLSDALIQLDVKTILASNEPGNIDPRLQNLINELKTVFRYSSYQLVGQNKLSLESNKKGSVSLPENRVMTIIPKGVSGNRVTLELEILKGNSQIFQSVIKLKNRSSITIGGPEYKGGNLLFNIFASF